MIMFELVGVVFQIIGSLELLSAYTLNRSRFQTVKVQGLRFNFKVNGSYVDNGSK